MPKKKQSNLLQKGLFHSGSHFFTQKNTTVTTAGNPTHESCTHRLWGMGGRTIWRHLVFANFFDSILVI